MNAYKLHVFERGQGRPVILLHGVLSTHRYWDSVVEMLEPRRQLLAPDLLGFGASPKPRRAAYSPEQMVACLEETFRRYHFKQPPVLAGHSYGANIALLWALHRPERFSGLVLSAPLFFEKDLLHQQLATIALEGKWLTSKALARMVAFGLSLSGLVPTRLAMRAAHDRPRSVIEDVTSQRFYVFRRMQKHPLYRQEVVADIQKIHIPTRILLGDKDLIASRAIVDLETVCQTNTMCRVQVLPGSHQVLLEHPEVVAKTILSV
ncbi:MAG TPA: alpha/beta hydrolase [Verrucomicrobiae bacterium]|nr:alpha/beta hydrolase [Verrucomicrobiae bacterium]